MFFAPLTPFYRHNFTKLKCQTVSSKLFHLFRGQNQLSAGTRTATKKDKGTAMRKKKELQKT
jgi:hypothetical protein